MVKKRLKKRKAVKSKDKAMASDKEYLYVAIEDINAFRVSILESSKAFLENLKSYHQLQALNTGKKGLVENIKKNMKDIELAFSKMQGLIPTKLVLKTEKVLKKQIPIHTKTMKHKKEELVVKNAENMFDKPSIPRQSNDIDRLFDIVQEKLSELK